MMIVDSGKKKTPLIYHKKRTAGRVEFLHDPGGESILDEV
jgi:hypothetical protein